MNLVSQAIGEIGLTKLAHQLGITHQALRKWEKTRVPAERLVEFERITGIPREAIRPEIFRR